MNTRKTALILRLLYPLWMLSGIMGLLYIPSQFSMAGEAQELAMQIQEGEGLFRIGIALRLLTQLLGLFIPYFLYELFHNRQSRLALFMFVSSLLGIPISMYGEVYSLLALSSLSEPALMMSHIDMQSLSLLVASLFWGLWLFPLGRLAIDSGYFPRLIGYALYVAGLGYFLGAFVQILLPQDGSMLEICEYLSIGEIIFILYLVIRGMKFPIAES